MLHYEVHIFINAYHSQGWRQAEKTHQEIFSCVFISEKKSCDEGEEGQDAIYEVILCKYLDPDNELPIGQSIRFLCVTQLV